MLVKMGMREKKLAVPNIVNHVKSCNSCLVLN
jgi:hypothetical protein